MNLTAEEMNEEFEQEAKKGDKGEKGKSDHAGDFRVGGKS